MKYARVFESIVQEVFTPPIGFSIGDCFTYEVVVLFEPCPDFVEQEWIKEPDGSFSPPLPPPPPPEPPEPEIKSEVDSPPTVETL